MNKPCGHGHVFTFHGEATFPHITGPAGTPLPSIAMLAHRKHGGPSRSRCGARTAAAPRWAHARAPSACAHLVAIARIARVRERQGPPSQDPSTPFPVAKRRVAFQELGLAPPTRLAVEEALHSHRCGTDAGSRAAPRRDPRARREVPAPRTRSQKIACRRLALTVVCVHL